MNARPQHRNRPHLHLVNPLWDPSGGGDWRTIDTWRLLRDHAEVELWSEFVPSAVFTCAYPIRRIRPLALHFPRGGTLAFIGTYFRIGHWPRLASFDRVLILYNTDQPDRLAKNTQRLARTGHRAEIVYTSNALRHLHGGRGQVLESPIDVARFRPPSVARPPRPFTVGRLSRDVWSKHHEDDPQLWRALASAGMRVRLMGATCLAPVLAGSPGIELLPVGKEDPAAFLHSLDAFVYRTSAHWFEAYGRVVVEAMATGLPVVAGARGGYAERLRDGANGFVVESTAEAIARVLALAADRNLAAALGAAARADAVSFNTEDLPRRTIALFTGRAGDGDPRAKTTRIANIAD
jgi:glycosyltransferase involved in cell wall biosynthesis